jgi:hypothetical protein
MVTPKRSEGAQSAMAAWKEREAMSASRCAAERQAREAQEARRREAQQKRQEAGRAPKAAAEQPQQQNVFVQKQMQFSCASPSRGGA